MLVSSFKNYSPSAIIKVPLFALVLWAFSPLYRNLPITDSSSIQMPLYSGISWFCGKYYFISVFLALFCHVLSAFSLNYIINEHNALSKKSYLPALLYLLFNAFLGELLQLHPATIANLLLIGAIHELLDTYRKDSVLGDVFNAGMLIGFASLLYLPACTLFLFVWITLAIFRPFIWREYVMSFCGVLVPWVYFTVWLFWHNRLHAFWTGMVVNPLQARHLMLPNSPVDIWLYFVFSLVAIAALLRLVSSHVVLPLKSKKTLSLLFWCFLLCLGSVYANPVISPSALILLSVPLAVFTSNLFLQVRKNWMAEFLFSLLLLAVVLGHLMVFLRK